jgi:hypothetical protein
MSWALHRIDDRLIHGQVLVAWGARLDPARIWVVDDGVAASPWERDLFQEAAPGIDVRVQRGRGRHRARREAAAHAPRSLLVRDLPTRDGSSTRGCRRVVLWAGSCAGKEKVNDVYLDDQDRGRRGLLAAARC